MPFMIVSSREPEAGRSTDFLDVSQIGCDCQMEMHVFRSNAWLPCASRMRAARLKATKK
ncbi:hypothetical protein [Rhizobium bangladeshense]|uniref:hypothetical protein n=1 Tax=Rhizobium bangladeshense TaxID=1138189 RepID=UPI003D7C2D59